MDSHEAEEAAHCNVGKEKDEYESKEAASVRDETDLRGGSSVSSQRDTIREYPARAPHHEVKRNRKHERLSQANREAHEGGRYGESETRVHCSEEPFRETEAAAARGSAMSLLLLS